MALSQSLFCNKGSCLQEGLSNKLTINIPFCLVLSELYIYFSGNTCRPCMQLQGFSLVFISELLWLFVEIILNKSPLLFRPPDNTVKQDNSESAFQVVGYRKGGKVLHEHWVWPVLLNNFCFFFNMFGLSIIHKVWKSEPTYEYFFAFLFVGLFFSSLWIMTAVNKLGKKKQTKQIIERHSKALSDKLVWFYNYTVIQQSCFITTVHGIFSWFLWKQFFMVQGHTFWKFLLMHFCICIKSFTCTWHIQILFIFNSQQKSRLAIEDNTVLLSLSKKHFKTSKKEKIFF